MMARQIYRQRLSVTGEKVRNVLVLIWMEDLEASGHTYGDLLSYLDSLHVPCAVSPVHDSDHWTGPDVLNWCTRHIDPETGDVDLRYCKTGAPYVGKEKDSHCHLLFKLKSQQNTKYWSELMCGLIDIRESMWEKCMDVDSSLRYFAHMDSPDKAQYDAGMIHGFGGLDMSALYKRSEADNVEIMMRVKQIMAENHVRYFYQLDDLVIESEDKQLISYLRGSYGYYTSILRSKADEKRDKAALDKMRSK